MRSGDSSDDGVCRQGADRMIHFVAGTIFGVITTAGVCLLIVSYLLDRITYELEEEDDDE